MTLDIAPSIRTSPEAFDAFLVAHQHEDTIYELIDGAIVAKPSNPTASKMSALLIIHIGMYLIQHDVAHITAEAGGYWVNGERYAPDVAVTLKAKQPELASSGYNPLPPDLAIEVDYPSSAESRRVLLLKVVNYLAAGTQVWLVDIEQQQVEVYVPQQGGHVLRAGDVLTTALLPDFSLPVAVLFPPTTTASAVEAT